MAEQYELSIGGDVVKVPAWATEETISKMSKYSEGTAKAMSELLRQWDSGNKVSKDNKKLFKQIAKSSQKTTEETVKSNKIAQKSSTKTIDAITKSSEKAVERTTKIVEQFEKGSLTGLTAAIGASGMLGLALGGAVSILEGFTNSIVTLSNQGVGLSTSLNTLRFNASQAGMNLDQYSEFVVSNGRALRALGDTTDAGASALAALSADIRTNALNQFNAFGLTVSELNELMTDEIEIRRIAGHTQDSITNNLTDSFNRLMIETTALSNLTGQDRRELLRQRTEAMSDSAVALSMTDQQRENFGMLTAVLGPAGSEIADAIGQSFASKRPFEAMNEEVTRMDQLSGGAIRRFYELFQTQGNSMERDEFMAHTVSLLQNLEETVGQGRLGTALTLSPDVVGAKSLIDFIADIRGLGKMSPEEILNNIQETGQAIADNELLGTSAALQDAINRIRASALTDVLDRLGVDVRTSGGALVDSIQSVADNFGFNAETGEFTGLLEGLRTTITDLTSESERIVAALALFGGGLVAVNGILRTLGISGAGTGILNGLRGGAQGARSGGLLNMLRGAGSKAGIAGLGLSGIFGAIDEEYIDSGYGVLDRAGIGIVEDVINMGDGIVNVATQLNRLWGGDGSNDVDMSQGFRDWVNSDTGRWWMSFGQMGSNPFDTGFKPGVSGSSPGYFVPEEDNMSIQGLTYSQDAPGQIDIGTMDPSTAYRHINSSNPENARQAREIMALIQEMMRENNRPLNAIYEEIRRLRRVTEESN